MICCLCLLLPGKTSLLNPVLSLAVAASPGLGELQQMAFPVDLPLVLREGSHTQTAACSGAGVCTTALAQNVHSVQPCARTSFQCLQEGNVSCKAGISDFQLRLPNGLGGCAVLPWLSLSMFPPVSCNNSTKGIHPSQIVPGYLIRHGVRRAVSLLKLKC